MSAIHRWFFAMLGVALIATALRAQFNLGKVKQGLDLLKKGADNAKETGQLAKGVAGIGPEEERAIGGSVAIEIANAHGGVMRDEAIIRRVNLVGKSLARYSTRPGLEWRFGVLASDKINAFSAPGGYVFITYALYELAPTDDALAAVLAHEIAHITRRHALKIIARGEAVSGASALAKKHMGDINKLDAQLKQFDVGISEVVKTLLEQGFDPATEFEADSDGRALAALTGYAPGGLRSVLLKLQGQKAAPGKIFSTHPPLEDRIKKLPADPAP